VDFVVQYDLIPADHEIIVCRSGSGSKGSRGHSSQVFAFASVTGSELLMILHGHVVDLHVEQVVEGRSVGIISDGNTSSSSVMREYHQHDMRCGNVKSR
jgi:hypothetical protein